MNSTIETTLLNNIKTVLSNFPEYWDEGTLLKNKVIEDLRSYDKNIITALLSNEKIKETYALSVSDMTIFKVEEFIEMLRYKTYWENSYTKYRNEIGLTSDGKYLNYNTDVVLDFPFKDCVLEGGMSNEDEGKKEVYYHNVIAKEEIDTLFSPKVLSKMKKFDKDGEHAVTEFNDDDNLIIKGNNLLALHTLKERYAGKVKLIYIDPPYNTGNDSFQYNDRFNRSTWLTFMKNRLSIAYELLKNDGIIFVHCDNNEQAHLKVLMDEIFGVKQFVETITVVNNPRGRDYGGIANMHEFIHVYSKSNEEYMLYKIIDQEKKFPYEDQISGYEVRELRNRNTAFHVNNRPNLHYPFYVNPNQEIDNGFLELSLEPKEGFKEVFPAESMGIKTVWRWGKSKSKENLNVNIVGKAMKEPGRYMIVEKYRDNSKMARSVWNDKSVNSEKGTVHLRKLFGEKIFAFPKPENLLSRILSIATKKNDVVLDFFMGSATTQAVAMKMNRRFIGIEQMGYINTVSIPRLQKVIEGEQGGISKEVDWQGGGSFVYAELDSLNQHYIDKLNEIASEEQLETILEELMSSAYLNFKVKLNKVTIEDEDFSILPLDEKKKVLIDVLDMNQLYLNYSEIDDTQYDISDEVKQFNHSFYGQGGE